MTLAQRTTIIVASVRIIIIIIVAVIIDIISVVVIVIVNIISIIISLRLDTRGIHKRLRERESTFVC